MSKQQAARILRHQLDELSHTASQSVAANSGGWISCSDRLPDLPKGSGKHHVMGYTPAKDAQRFANGSRFLYWNGIDWRYPDGARFEHRVTHWQPFLAPPTA
jgi:hypothetical protein